jgi:hypothetical protein
VIFLSPPTIAPAAVRAFRAGAIGILVTPAHGIRAGVLGYARHWAADNGCFAQGERFDADRWLAWLDRLPRARCLFAVAPDVVGDAAATWRRSAPWLPRLRALGFPAAYVAQDGLDAGALDWDAFDALFVGGTTGYKLSEAAYAAVAEAKRRGKWCHMGRCNSRIRLRAAYAGGYDSADGTHMAFKPDVRTAQILRWLGEIEGQAILPMGDTA